MRIFTRGSKIIRLPKKLYELLVYFTENPNRVISREELHAEVWNNWEIKSNTIDVQITLLRKRLNENFGQSYIETVRGFGYMFINNPT